MERYTKLDCLIDLRRRILSTELKPGHDLDEARLSDYYSMSRTPLREVLQRAGTKDLGELLDVPGAVGVGVAREVEGVLQLLDHVPAVIARPGHGDGPDPVVDGGGP